VNKGDQAMNDMTIGLEQTEEEMLIYEVSDEALESATGTGNEEAGNYTLYFCTALDLCPGP
jgi:hypothetical protein